jgi:hypothetical protein
VTASAGQRCYVELNTTGGTTSDGGVGISFVMFGLDSAGNGLSSYHSSAPKPAPVSGGAFQPVSAGPPSTVNVTMDHDAVLAAMLQLHDHFNAAVGDRNVCLKNAKAGGWTDIQAHYYCLLPLNNVRRCFSGTVIALSAAPATAATAVPAAYDTCFKNSTDPDGIWVHANQQGVFKYVMFTQQGTADFDIASQNATIGDYYAKIGTPRPRRVTDTYPAWLPEQPRYDAIEAAQIKAQGGSSH